MAKEIVKTVVNERVRELRLLLGLTQQALADRGGVSRVDVVRVESGANKISSHAMREAIAKGFGLTSEDANAYLDGKISARQAMRRSVIAPAERAKVG